jgi:hypothetical protein
MARIPTTPSVRTFTETWSADFKEAVNKAAGKDGRLTMSEAKTLAARPDAGQAVSQKGTGTTKAGVDAARLSVRNGRCKHGKKPRPAGPPGQRCHIRHVQTGRRR